MEHLLGNSCDFKIVNLFIAWHFISVFYVYKDDKYKDDNKLKIRPTFCEMKLLTVDQIWILIKIFATDVAVNMSNIKKNSLDPQTFFTFYRDK